MFNSSAMDATNPTDFPDEDSISVGLILNPAVQHLKCEEDLRITLSSVLDHHTVPNPPSERHMGIMLNGSNRRWTL